MYHTRNDDGAEKKKKAMLKCGIKQSAFHSRRTRRCHCHHPPIYTATTNIISCAKDTKYQTASSNNEGSRRATSQSELSSPEIGDIDIMDIKTYVGWLSNRPQAE